MGQKFLFAKEKDASVEEQTKMEIYIGSTLQDRQIPFGGRSNEEKIYHLHCICSFCSYCLHLDFVSSFKAICFHLCSKSYG